MCHDPMTDKKKTTICLPTTIERLRYSYSCELKVYITSFTLIDYFQLVNMDKISVKKKIDAIDIKMYNITIIPIILITCT